MGHVWQELCSGLQHPCHHRTPHPGQPDAGQAAVQGQGGSRLEGGEGWVKATGGRGGVRDVGVGKVMVWAEEDRAGCR